MKRNCCYIILLFLCLSCADDNGTRQPLNGNVITLQLAPIAGDATRVPGEDEFNENAVENIQIFFYDENGQECLYTPEAGDMEHDGSSNMVTITIPADKASDILDHNLTIYVVANSGVPIDPEGRTLLQLQQITYTNSATFNELSFTAQDHFLMDGKISKVKISSSGSSNLPPVLLRRAAAKIAVTIDNTQIDNYEAVSAEIRLSNYLDKTSLGSDAENYAASKDEYLSSPFRPMSLPGKPVTNEGPLYSYANDWEFDAVIESYITVKVHFKHTTNMDENDYYYRIPFNYIPDDPDDKKKFCLRRNFIYEFDVDLKELGGNNPEDAVELSPSFTIKDWTTEDIEISINPYDYLLVEERYVEMHDITGYDIPYVSSTKISIQMDSVFHYYYEKSGKINRIDHMPGADYYPTIIANQQTNKINVNCMVPINYVPTHIYFTVKAESGLKQQVNIMLYPRIYVTAERSPGPQGARYGENFTPGTNTNINFYTVTVKSLAPGDDFVLGDPTIRVNNQLPSAENPSRVTYADETSNNIVSPQFVIGSQRGITRPTITQETAKLRCATYYESPYMYTVGMWRVPTYSELKLVAKLHRDPQSALKELFVPPDPDTFWWVARFLTIPEGRHMYSVRVAPHPDDTKSFIGQSEFHANGSSVPPPYHAVRCVYDVWRPYEKNGYNKEHDMFY